MGTEEEKVIRLRWLDTSAQRAGDVLLCDALNPEFMDGWKRRAVEALGIKVAESEKPSDAWLRAMSEENGLEYRKPVAREIALAIRENIACYRFYFAII